MWQQGWLSSAIKTPSPNFGTRTRTPDLVVIHNISLPPFEYGNGSVQALFQNRIEADAHPFFAVIQNLRVSSHFFVARTGELFQFVSCDDAAYHAGVSAFRGEASCNGFSVGIELEGCDFEAFNPMQYETLLRLLRQLQDAYPIRAVTGHQHIAPDRKTDPGHFFDWQILHNAGVPVDLNQAV